MVTRGEERRGVELPLPERDLTGAIPDSSTPAPFEKEFDSRCYRGGIRTRDIGERIRMKGIRREI